MKKLITIIITISFLIGNIEINANPKQIRNIHRDNSGKKNFFLTFNGHEKNENFSSVIFDLKRMNVEATFFLTGEYIKRFPEDVKRIVVEGHIVGNHTLTHSRNLTPKQLIYELQETERLFFECTGEHMTKIWRAPYSYNNELLAAAQSIGYTHIDVTLSTADWAKWGEKEYIDNEEFIEMFKKGLNFSKLGKVHLTGETKKYYQSSTFDYKGVIMLMHLGEFRKPYKRLDRDFGVNLYHDYYDINGNDFVHSLGTYIRILQKENYSFKTCNKFDISENKEIKSKNIKGESILIKSARSSWE